MKNLLIVDDEKTLQLSLAYGLTRREPGLNVITAGNGFEALARLKTCPVDMVVTDLNMPLMNGYELIAQMQEHYPEIPVLPMTAAPPDLVEEPLTMLGITSYIEKTTDFDRLFSCILAVLRPQTACSAV
ncbi:MAG: response regulator [Nitrospiraceae bacterium]|nr:response regulator [Nitrospiraceae bacterium]